ncbi:MAG: hypothetical protein AAB482_00465 [Patescibacteria group bacterium]|mgnify:CR=1 FL=1
MIDSVVLQLNSNQFKLREKNRFHEIRTQQGRGFSTNTRYCAEYSETWKKKGVYCPMFGLPIRKQGLAEPKSFLEIQESLPKHVHGTSLFDIDKSDLDTIFEKNLYFLDDLGVDTSKEELERAVVRRADFSKIFKLPDYLGKADEVVRTLTLFNYKPQSEFRMRDYCIGSEGIALKFWNTTQGYVVYDKFGEILSDGYKTKQELKLKELYDKGRLTRNALRFELSLQRKDSFEALVRRRVKTGKKKDFFLEEILDKDLAQAILTDAFEKVFSDIAVGLISLSQMEDNKLWSYLERSGMSQNKQEKLYYWVRMATKSGIAGTWEQLKLKLKGGSIPQRKKEISLALQELGTISGNVPNLVDFLRAEHEKFEIIRPKGTLLDL